MRILHLSDPHFSQVCFHPRQFLSKQWLGNLNLALFRRGRYQTSHLEELPELATQLKVEFVMLTGDMSSTSQPIELEMARDFVHLFQQPVLTLPGNHDAYTRTAEQTQIYYHYFPSKDMQALRIEKRSLQKGWWWVGLDCARANNVLKSNGAFYAHMDEPLHDILRNIPQQDSVIIGNHFPLYTRGRPLHDTARAKALQTILRTYPQVKLYLHGHDHAPYMIDRQDEGFPLVLNAGTIAYLPGGTFYLLDLNKQECRLTRYRREITGWKEILHQTFKWHAQA